MKLHHIGFVVADIQSFSEKSFTGDALSEIEDPVQKAKLALFAGHSDVMLELIQPLDPESFTWNFLQKNGEGFHHLCYQASLDEIVKLSVEKKLIKLLGPVPAKLFDNRDVLFYLNRNRQIVEFLID